MTAWDVFCMIFPESVVPLRRFFDCAGTPFGEMIE
jgi:hypothetical protein